MKRDMDLVRKILFALEDTPGTRAPANFEIEGYEPEQIGYHVMLMHQAGLLHATNASTRESLQWLPLYLNWSGHEFLEAARNDTTWNKAKAAATKVSGTVFEVVKEVLIRIAVEAASRSKQ